MSNSLALNLTDQQKNELKEYKNSPNIKKTVLKRIDAILLLAEDKTAQEVVKIVNARPNSVGEWRKAYLDKGISGILNTSGHSMSNILTPTDEVVTVPTSVNSIESDSTDTPIINGKTSTLALDGVLASLLSNLGSRTNELIYSSVASILATIAVFLGNLGDSSQSAICSHIAEALSNISNILTKISENKTYQNAEILEEVSKAIRNTDTEYEKDKQSKGEISKTESPDTVKIEITLSGLGVQETTLIELQTNDVDFTSKLQFGEHFSSAYQKIHESMVSAGKRAINFWSNQAALNYVNGDASKLIIRDGISFGGRYKITIPYELNKEYVNTELIWDPRVKALYLQAISNESYRKGTEHTNACLQLSDEDKVKYRTIHHMCEREGEKIDEYIDENILPTLEKNGFDINNGDVTDENKIPDEVKNPELDKDNFNKINEDVIYAAENYNEDKDEKNEQIQPEVYVNECIFPPQNTAYVSADHVVVKAQKTERKKYVYTKTTDKGKKRKVKIVKKKKTINSAVVSISTAEGSLRIVADTMQRALMIALATMLEKHLLDNKALVFFTDGEAAINDVIKRMFGFRQYCIKLDYYHLKKKCYEYFSMALIGGKKNRTRNEEIRKKFYSIIYAGNYQAALDYLDTIDKAFIKDMNYIDKIKDYLNRKKEYLYSYALYKMLGLKNSSNDVENYNNQLVADRCKNNGRSWLERGINGMRNIKCMESNNEQDWYTKGELYFEPTPPSDISFVINVF